MANATTEKSQFTPDGHRKTTQTAPDYDTFWRLQAIAAQRRLTAEAKTKKNK